jgi:hypothetical protein
MSQMGRFVKTGICTAAMLLAVPSIALAAPQYEGQIVGEPSSEVSFEIVRKKHKRIVVFSATKLVTACPSGPETVSFDGLRFRLTDGGFGGSNAVPAGDPRPTSYALLNGDLGRRGRASGTVQVVEQFDFFAVCDTGELRWKARAG